MGDHPILIGPYTLGLLLKSQGRTSKVYNCSHKDYPDTPLIMKECRKDNLSSIREKRTFQIRLQQAGDAPDWLTMQETKEYIYFPYLKFEGETLKDFKDKKLAVKNYKAVLEELLKLHKLNINHGDLHPGNIMIRAIPGQNVEVKIIDMGSSFQVGDKKAIEGNRLLMSPEQARNNTVADQRSDLYALAGTMYTLITGHEPINPLRSAGATISFVILKSVTLDMRFMSHKSTVGARGLQRKHRSGNALSESQISRVQAVVEDKGIAQLIVQSLSIDPKDRPADCEEAMSILESPDPRPTDQVKISFASNGKQYYLQLCKGKKRWVGATEKEKEATTWEYLEHSQKGHWASYLGLDNFWWVSSWGWLRCHSTYKGTHEAHRFVFSRGNAGKEAGILNVSKNKFLSPRLHKGEWCFRYSRKETKFTLHY